MSVRAVWQWGGRGWGRLVGGGGVGGIALRAWGGGLPVMQTNGTLLDDLNRDPTYDASIYIYIYLMMKMLANFFKRTFPLLIMTVRHSLTHLGTQRIRLFLA